MDGADFKHRPVMLEQCIEGLNIDPAGVYFDGTVGGGGHSFEIAGRLTTGKLLCTDKDSDAISLSYLSVDDAVNACLSNMQKSSPLSQ